MFFYILTVCCITDMHINVIHISVILRGLSRGPSLFCSFGVKIINIMPREISQFGKKSAKVYHSLFSSSDQLQVALWNNIFLWLGLNNEMSFHTLPLLSVPFHISPSLSLPLQTLCLVSLVSLITKTKRIAERSANVTHTHTHTQSHTDRQSTKGKYMIN